MRRLPIALTVILSVLSIAGQEEHRVSVSDFPGMVTRGLKVIERGPYRYTTHSEGFRTVTLEVDAKGSIRTKSFDGRTGETGECVIIGQRIYHRSGNGSWTSQTKDEYEKAQANMSAAMKDARSKKDTAAHEKLRAATPNNLAIFYALFRPASSPLTAPQISDKTIVFVGNLPHRDKIARFYRLLGNMPGSTPPSAEIGAMRTEILYAFDPQTGALLKAHTRHDWVYKSEQKTFFGTDEWEPDPAIVITAPVTEDLKRQD